MRKIYTEPEVTIENFKVEDVITASPDNITGGEGDANTGGGGGLFD